MVNLEDYFKRGQVVGNPLVSPGDAVHVTWQTESWARRNVPIILTSLASIAAMWLVYDRITEE